METDYIIEEEDIWECRKHASSRPRSGVCPSCLRDRLLLLCPDCASLRPCSCFPSSSSSSSSSFSSHSSFDPARSCVSGAIGSVGRVSNLLESEPAFRRSRSAAFPLIRPPRSDPVEAVAAAEKGWRWGSFLGFLKGREKREEQSFSRSRSVGVSIYNLGSVAGAREGRLKAKKWQFPSPMRVFRQMKTARVVHERSPLCTG